MNKESEYKNMIKENINHVLDSGFIPELGTHKSGKVRDIHFKSKKIGNPIIMIASDRVSSFDHILNRRIPFKGRILNLLNKWALDNTKDIVPNASMPSPHQNVLVQTYYENIMIECVVRGYVWGSLAGEYESGKRTLCGVKLPEGLLRYEKLKEPIFTPTTKSEHDEPMTFEDVEKKLGKEMAKKVKETSIKLYERGAELAKKAGLIFIDTKYEFGTDEKGQLYLIDEANTPDSSRYCSEKEYEKFEKIKQEMKSGKGKYKDVSELLKAESDFKIKEMSKQFVRDVLIKKGFSYGSTGELPSLDDEDVIETSYRYIELYETLTGEKFKFPDVNTKSELIEKLQKAGYIKGELVVIMAGSDSDISHIEKIQSELEKYDIKSEVRICSAHKQPRKCEEIVRKYNDSLEPIIIIAVAGGTDALSGTASFHSVHPVISCPPNKEEYESCINNPPGSSNSLILRPANVARHCAQIFSSHNEEYAKNLLEQNAVKIKKLENADEKA